MKLEVGMHGYNKTNRKLGIGEIISFPINNNVNIKYKNDIVTISIGNVEASHNIIDLIEVGDYVNGMQVIAKDSDNRLYVPEDLGQPYCREFSNGCFDYTLLDMEHFKIKSIVTKEQFEAMKYKVV